MSAMTPLDLFDADLVAAPSRAADSAREAAEGTLRAGDAVTLLSTPAAG